MQQQPLFVGDHPSRTSCAGGELNKWQKPRSEPLSMADRETSIADATSRSQMPAVSVVAAAQRFAAERSRAAWCCGARLVHSEHVR